jgi:hypothetical protein
LPIEGFDRFLANFSTVKRLKTLGIPSASSPQTFEVAVLKLFPAK